MRTIQIERNSREVPTGRVLPQREGSEWPQVAIRNAQNFLVFLAITGMDYPQNGSAL